MPLPKTGARGVPEVGTEGAPCAPAAPSQGAVLTCPRHAEGDSGRARMHTQLIHLRGQECTPRPAATASATLQAGNALPLGSGRLAE